MEGKLEKIKKINPVNENGIPKNKGNCQWCAIEGARVLLQDVEPTEIPEYEGGNDPLEGIVHKAHNTEEVETDDPREFFAQIQELKVGELMLVSLESTSSDDDVENLDHAYIIYRDANEIYLIDPDRQIFVELDERENFHQDVKGWDNVNKINYLNGDLNSAFKGNVKACICVLNKEAISKPDSELPEYGTEVPGLSISF